MRSSAPTGFLSRTYAPAFHLAFERGFVLFARWYARSLRPRIATAVTADQPLARLSARPRSVAPTGPTLDLAGGQSGPGELAV